jgi:hypothetical protein
MKSRLINIGAAPRAKAQLRLPTPGPSPPGRPAYLTSYISASATPVVLPTPDVCTV